MDKLLVNDATGGSQDLELGEALTIGRLPLNDLCLPEKSVSGQHAVIKREADGYVLEDLDSTNGTLVNGRQVAKHKLAPGDVVAIGASRITFIPGAMAQSSAIPRLKVLTGSRAGQELPLAKPVITLGKPGVVVVQIRKGDDGYSLFVTERGGDNSPPAIVNAKAVGETPVLLRAGDELDIAGTVLRFIG